VQSGLVITFVALLVLHFTLRENMHPSMLVPGLALYGAGMGLVLSQINNLTLSAVPVRDAGEASGVTNTFRQVGSSLGAAIIGAILLQLIIAGLGGHQDPHQAMSLAFGAPLHDAHQIAVRKIATTRGIRAAMLYGAACAIVGLIVTRWLPMRANVKNED